ncbi:hypothetical protein FACS1894105_06810 [Clostridia bacterium]|nr:hypothetical protein FACS1894105_06810 [Clostridia bacterium]
MCRLLGNTANNVNQIARRANQTGNIYAADLEELALRYDELLLQSKVVLKKISAMKV